MFMMIGLKIFPSTTPETALEGFWPLGKTNHINNEF
jgi:hypothetical protein